jgi:ferredoxin--NADP+ reductase
VAFDKTTHTVPHFGGSVLNTASSTGRMPGLYVAGWLKRGPSGIIGTNISDAQQTATALILDWQVLRVYVLAAPCMPV